MNAKTIPYLAVGLLLMTTPLVHAQETEEALSASEINEEPQNPTVEMKSAPEEELADMSDPLAVFTQAGFSVGDRGVNIKLGKKYDTGSLAKLGMNIFEVKGILSDTLGWESGPKDSIDSVRIRNLTVNPTNGRGAQIDLVYDFNQEAGALSYSMFQALPAMWRFNFYPLAGAGGAFANNVLQDDDSTASGYSMPGTFATVGMFSKLTITDKLWINYTPMWNTTLSGSDSYKDRGFADHSSVLTHEASLSYRINPRMNIRYFANWNQYLDFSDGNHRIEVNYQF